MGFKSLFVLIGVVSLLAVLLTAVSPEEEFFPILAILIWVLVATVAIYLAVLFQKLSEYPGSREAIEKRIAGSKEQIAQ